MNFCKRAYHLVYSSQCFILYFYLVILGLVKINCSFSVSFSSFVKFRSMREVSFAAAAANKCQRISVSYANILPGWKRTHFTAINVVFAGKLLRIRSR